MSERPVYDAHPDLTQVRGTGAAAHLPVSRRPAKRVLCLTLYPALRDEDCARVSALVRDYLARVHQS